MSIAASLIIFTFAMRSDTPNTPTKVKMCDDLLSEAVIPYEPKLLIAKARQLLVGGTNEPLLDLMMHMEDDELARSIHRQLDSFDMDTVCAAVLDLVHRNTTEPELAYQEAVHALQNL